MKYLIGFILGCWLVTIVIVFTNIAEENECINWNRYAKESASMGLKSYSWQKQQCATHNIILNY